MMLTFAAFHDAILAVHILAVIVAFGVLFIYPLLGVIGVRGDPQAMPWFHRLQWAIHMRVSAPGLGVVVLAGIYLATDLHQWSKFYVGWGIVAALAIGAIGGAYISPREKRLAELAQAELAQADLTSAGSGPFEWSPAYLAARQQAHAARLIQLAITVVTVFFMAFRLGG